MNICQIKGGTNMNFRTKEYYENRIAKLKASGEIINDKLIKKAQRQLNKLA